jgi:hypothetical protein
MKPRVLDFNLLLRLGNAVIAGMLVFAYRDESLPTNHLVDSNTVLLGLLLCLQTHVALWFERRHRDPFVLLLATWMIIYYQLRIFTLVTLPFSNVFMRFPYEPSDSNFALLFIIFANLWLYVGLHAVRLGRGVRVPVGDARPKAPVSVIAVLLFSILLTYFGGNFWSEDNVPRALQFLQLFMNPQLIIQLALVYLLLFRRELPPIFAIAIAGLIGAEMVAHTLWGSRSAVMGFAQVLLLTALAVRGVLQIRLRTAFIGLALAPLAVGLMVAAFVISTQNRAVRAGAANLDVSRSLEIAGEASAKLSDSPLLDVVLPPIASRAGYFDYSAEIMAHRERYAEVFTLSAYWRSIIDNILTPGFDVFDQPRISNAARFVYEAQGRPSKTAVTEAYHSDQYGMYGEAYALFGFGALPWMTLFAMVLKGLYVRLRDSNPFLLAAKRAIVLLVFVRWIDSFGFDWLLFELIPYIASFFIFSFVFTVRGARPRSAATPPAELPPSGDSVSAP